jgi:hypothetical protein
MESTRSMSVRRFTESDFREAMKEMGDQRQHLTALVQLKSAIARDRKDEIARTREKLSEYAALHLKIQLRLEELLRAGTPQGPKIKRNSRPHTKKPPENSMWKNIKEAFEAARPPADPQEEFQRTSQRYRTEKIDTLYAREMFAALQGTKLVLWKSHSIFTPALFCDNPQSACYAMALFYSNWAICPYSRCGKWFMPRQQKQSYCCPQHREAHRVARWREQIKAESKGA